MPCINIPQFTQDLQQPSRTSVLYARGVVLQVFPLSIDPTCPKQPDLDIHSESDQINHPRTPEHPKN